MPVSPSLDALGATDLQTDLQDSNTETAALLDKTSSIRPTGFCEEYYLVVCCLLIQFLMNFSRDAYIASCPIITNEVFKWTSNHTGIFIAFMSLAVIPSNLVMIRLKYERRTLLIVIPIFMMLSCVALIEF